MYGDRQQGTQRNDRFREDYRPRVEWESVKEFVSQDYDPTKGGFCAKVSVLKIRPPRYSYELVWKLPDNKYSRHLNASYFLDRRSVDEVVNLAQNYVNEQSALAESMAKKQAEHDAQKAEQDKAKKLAKKARHETNLARRREEDRARTNAGKTNKQSK